MTPALTVLTASARLDLARLWLGCVKRALGREDPVIEIFAESDGVLRADLLPGAVLLRPAPGRRDYQESYNDALRRVSTPYLALIDTDVLWTSTDTWRSVRARLADGRVAAVSCVSRRATEGHGTFAVFLRVAPYRAALDDVPDGFFARAVEEQPGPPPGRWHGYDTGDLLMRAVIARGGRVDLLHLDDAGDFVRFDALTGTRLLETWAGSGAILELARYDAQFRRGCLGNLALRSVHARLFPEGPAFEFDLSAASFWTSMALKGPRGLGTLREARRVRGDARRVERFLRDPLTGA